MTDRVWDELLAGCCPVCDGAVEVCGCDADGDDFDPDWCPRCGAYPDGCSCPPPRPTVTVDTRGLT